jgi:thiamine pyrophosphate-dependent acetolactate synthase large subunit-like protein
MLAAADLILMLGIRAGTEVAADVAKQTKANIAYVGFDDPREPEPNDEARGDAWPGAAVSSVADCRLFLEALLPELSGPVGGWGDAAREQIATYRQGLARGLEALWHEYRDRRPVHFGLATAELAQRLRPDAVVLGGMGNHNVWARRAVPVLHPFSQLLEGMWGSMGSELPGAIIAKLLFPERQVVALTGDGSFLMACSDFGTAVEEGANIVVMILNDSGYGMIEQMQEHRYGRSYGARIGAVDFARFAESFGAAGVRVEDPRELPEALDRALALAEARPVIVDVVSYSRYTIPDIEELLAYG